MDNPRRIKAAPENQAVLCVAFSPDGRSLAVTGEHGFVKIVPVISLEDMPDALSTILMPFTRSEFLPEDANFLTISADVMETLYGSNLS